MKTLFTTTLSLLVVTLLAQDHLPYREMPAAAESYTAGAVAARMLDGLGFRFYWATEGLRAEDVAFKPGKDSRTTEETVAHIYGMSVMILDATTKTIYVERQDKIPFAEMRRKTLQNLERASDRLRQSTDKEVAEYKVKVQVGTQVFEFPFWNLVNGPISDCLWHTGQIVSFRRLSGNPFSGKADVFTGTVAQ